MKICLQEGTKGAPFYEQKWAAKQRRASKTRFCEWRGWTVMIYRTAAGCSKSMHPAAVLAFWGYSSLVPFCVQIPCLHENLNAEGYEGSAILWAKRAAKQRRASKTRFCEWRGWTVTISGKAQEFLWITGCQFLFFPLYFSGHSLCGLWGHKSTKQSDINTQNSESTERTIWVF